MKAIEKFLVYGAENRRRLMAGADTFARAVCVTYGPKGRVVMLNRTAGLMATKDGVTVAREVEVHDPVGQLACQALKDACIQVNNIAGDGTTSTACIAAHILHEGVRVCAGDLNPIFVSRGVQAAAKAAVEVLREIAHPITLQEHLERVALVASNGDAEVASKMAEAVMAVGKRGTVSIEDGPRVETTLVFRDGMVLDRGAASDVFLQKKLERVLEAPLVAVIAAPLTTSDDVLDMCEEATTYGGHPLLVFCDGISGEALKTLILNDTSKDHNFEFVAVLAPGNFEAKKAYLGDIAALAGARMVDPAQGMSHKKWDSEWFGGLRKATIGARKSTLEAYEESAGHVAERVQEIQATYRHTQSQYDTDRLNERIAALEGGLCIMQIGATTEAELKEKRARVEDALSAVQGALEEGVLPGGGTAYLVASERIRGLCPDDESFDFKAGWGVVVQALRMPILTLAENAGEETRDVLHQVLEAQKTNHWMGWNAIQGSVEDFSQHYGVVDPLRVGVAVVEAASSVAAMLLTSEVSILNVRRR